MLLQDKYEVDKVGTDTVLAFESSVEICIMSC